MSCNFKDNKVTPQPDKILKNLKDPDGSFKKIRQNNCLFIGMDTSTGLPFINQDKETKKNVGFEIEVGKYIAKKMGVNFKVVETKWGDLLNKLDGRKFDMVLNALEKPEDNMMLKTFAFSVPYYVTSFQVIVPAGDRKTYGIMDLKKRKIGVIQNSIPEIFLKEINRIKQANISIKAYPGLDELFNALKKKNLNAAFVLSPFAQWYCLNNPTFRMATEKISKVIYVVAFKKEDTGLISAVNIILKNAKKDPEFRHIFTKWGLEN